ncbi:transporter substrate-binding domain-containing protein [Pseudomonas sivasensis]|jgi:branched-chain amino acid transport system substrate-binding protein|uniref:transporter substrate-binding domain-containing protein n=1 Tax=Pseudomonas TaxID=286 RepID=UPI000447AB51|nr:MULTISPECIES: transporter substrate-binding domain-containing protein [Pseudomonas]EZP67555.1 branched-chain amino acid ABC transporter periplasmic component-like protein [Pseudomonas sp. RIT357]MBA2928817.1 transporter substrate-binding domain-containing protein [Pseudomonas sivasensis]
MSASDYKVGLLFSESSLTAASETTQANATHLAIAEVNDAGGIHGRPLVPVDGHPGAEPSDYRDSALRLCDEHQVQVLFGTHMSSTRKVVLPVVESRRRLLFYPTLYEGFEYSPWCYYTGSAPNQNSVQLAQYVLAHFGNRVLFVGGSYVYPFESNRIMRELFEQAGGEVVDEIYLPFHATAEDFERVMQRARATAPDAIYSTIVGSDIPALHRAYRQAGFDPARMPIVSLATNEVDVLHMSDEEAEGHVSAAPWFSTLATPASQAFVARYRARFGDTAPLTAGGEAAYFQVHLFAEAARRAEGSSIEALRKALAGAQFDAPQGRVQIDPDTQHTWLWPRIARLDHQRRFELVVQSEQPVKPSPYMVDYQLDVQP